MAEPTNNFDQDLDAKREETLLRNKLEAQTEADDIKWLMGTKRGRRIVHRLMAKAGVFRLSFDQNAMRMAFNEGNRNMGNSLLALVTELCPDKYLDLINEAKDK